MSSILKALKKLEKESEDPGPVRLWQQNNHGKHTDERLRFRSRNVIISVGLIIAVGAGVFLNQNFRKRNPDPIPQNEAQFQKSARLPEKKEAPPEYSQKEPSIEKDVQKPESIQKTAPVFSSKPPENASETAKKKFSKPEPIREETMADRQAEKETVDRFASIPVRQSDETKIEVQAIAWANDPKNRLAVINGLILREGESIDNAIVMHIGKDEIILRKEGVQWKQLFGF